MNENMAMLGRRSFLMGMGVMGAGIVGMSTAGCSPKPKEEEHASGDAANAEPSEVTADTVEIINTRDLMTIEELNAKRKQLVDSKTDDYVKADGTVIPNVYVKLQALLNTYTMASAPRFTTTASTRSCIFSSRKKPRRISKCPWE